MGGGWLPGLFDPINIRGLSFKNRLVMPPMATGMAAEYGEVTDRHMKHYTARAKSGVGLIIIEHTHILEEGKLSRTQTGIYDDRLIPSLKRLVESIHAEGARVIIQLNHGGAKAPRSIIGKQPSGPWGYHASQW